MKKITIIIPTYNRPERLKRLLNYYNDNNQKVDFELIVADSSSDENKEINKKIVFSFSGLDILYLDKYSQDKIYYCKLADVLNYVKTKYCLFCADDDFIILNSAIQAADFLESHPDFTLAHGHYVRFRLKGKGKRKELCLSLAHSITSADPKLRVIEHFSNFTPGTFYALHRTDFLKMIFEETRRYIEEEEKEFTHFSEFLPSLLSLIYGKMKALDLIYGVREDRETTPGALSITTKYVYDFFGQSDFVQRYIIFRDHLAFHLSRESEISLEEAKKVIDKAIALHIERRNFLDFDSLLQGRIKYISFKHFLADKIRKIMPKFLYQRVRFIGEKLFPSIKRRDKRLFFKDRLPDKYNKDFEICLKYLL